jgi:ATP-dependent RNA helicase RhlB
MDFSSFNLPEVVLKGIETVGFTECTKIQEATIPLALKGNDVAGQAQTGTGKTAAFLIVMFTKLLKDPPPPDSRKQARAIIIAPSRELVAQIYEDAMSLGQYTGLTMAPIFGGIDYQKQAQILRKGVDIIIGTPGRLIDYYNQQIFSLKKIKMLVVDEADRMFDMGFIKDIRFIMRKLPPYNERQSMLFSATLSNRVMELAYEHMNMPEKIAINPGQITVDRVEQHLYHVGKNERFSLLMGILKTGCDRTMIFSNTRHEAQQITDWLRANHYHAQAITGDIPQKKRLRILDSFKQGLLPILVATDVASRGIHIDDVTHVINYCLPQDREDYVHRIGRTARAGASGKAISLACDDCALYLESIEDFIKGKIPVSWADDELLVSYHRPPRKKSILVAPRKPDQRKGDHRKVEPRRGELRRGELRRGEPKRGEPKRGDQQKRNRFLGRRKPMSARTAGSADLQPALSAQPALAAEGNPAAVPKAALPNAAASCGETVAKKRRRRRRRSNQAKKSQQPGSGSLKGETPQKDVVAAGEK